MNAVSSTVSGGTIHAAKQMHLVLACDENFAMPLAACLRSVAEANSECWPLAITILADRCGPEMCSKVEKSLPDGAATIRWLPIALDQFSACATIGHISRVTYARLLIDQLLPVETERILFIDPDTLILASLEPLWSIDLQGAILGGVMDLGITRDVGLNIAGYDQVPRVKRYFNAGVLLIDVRRWRQEEVSQKAMRYLKENPDSPFSDQDALNVACDGRWLALGDRWNFQDHYFTSIGDLPETKRPTIVHFICKGKPWVVEIPSVNARLFDSFRSRTRYARSTADRMRDCFRAGWARIKRIVRMVLGHAARRNTSASGSASNPVSKHRSVLS